MPGTREEPAALEVVVLLGTDFARLRDQGTRWRFVLRAWANDGRVLRLVALDFPRLSPRHALGRALARPRPSWLEGCELLEPAVAVHRASTIGARRAWAATGRAVNDVLGPALAPRIAIAATPLAVPLLRHLDVHRRGFDAVDDWRALPGVQHLGAHVRSGYAQLGPELSCSSVSARLGEVLRSDYGVIATTVPNGVDLEAYAHPGPAPDGLPSGPFAVYVGVVQERFDLALLESLGRAGVPVVVAGPAPEAMTARLRASGAHCLGRVDVALVPGLLQRAAVGIVPHRIDALTASMDPMKVLEYLAAGLPVVTTPVARSVISDRVTEAEGEAFVAAVLQDLDVPRLSQPDPAVHDRDWSAVADALLRVHQ